MRSWRVAGLVVLTLILLGGGAMLGSVRSREARSAAAVNRSLARSWSLENAGLQRQASAAGISLQRPEVRPLNRSRLGPAGKSSDFHAYFQRCTSCHATPDPSLHAPAEWADVVLRMDGWMEAAGLLPMEERERAAVLRFLIAASSGR